jgi:primosomal protein N' (replication factor Y)
MYAQVLVFLPIRSKTSPFFDYAIPSDLARQIQPGVLVVVPLRQRVLPGIVMALVETPAVPDTRPIQSVLDPDPALPPRLLNLARWMARETLTPMHKCVLTMLPPGLRPQAYLRLSPQVIAMPQDLTDEFIKDSGVLKAEVDLEADAALAAKALMHLLLERGPLKSSQIARALKDIDWHRARHYLQKRGYIKTERRLRLPHPHPKTVRMVRLAAPRTAWEEGFKGLRYKDRDHYREILSFLEDEGQPVEVNVVYAETSAELYQLKTLVRRGLASFSRQEVIRDPLAERIYTPEVPPPLTPDQQAAWEVIQAELARSVGQHETRHQGTTAKAVTTNRARSSHTPTPILLMGVTGSGKTELYLRATAEVLTQDRCALILVPEISLTPQTVRRFAVRFPGQVGLWHSGMSEGERYDTWRRARQGDIKIVVGARSALFTPFPRLGLIVLDEEEDTSYKQKRRPYYHTREVAEELARRTGALLILGSATPTLESTLRAQEGRYRMLQLSRRVLGHRRRIMDWQAHLHLSESRYRPLEENKLSVGQREARPRPTEKEGGLTTAKAVTTNGVTNEAANEGKHLLEAWTVGLPPVQVVDMRAELKAGNRSIFSRALQNAVDQALDATNHRNEQVILFLNRRGTATYVFCRDCGWVAQCPRCDIPLTYHGGLGALLCHRCGYREASIRDLGQQRRAHCPKCGSPRVRAFGLGTAGLETRVYERWPEAYVLRWDRDTARTHAAHHAILGRFARGEADILVGTQMIARGLDLPGVTVVGIISADTGLNLPDFRAVERTFQLLTQVAGRAGRGLMGGRVILQTYHPEHYAIQHAAIHDYAGFAAQELAFRHEAGYPPFIRLGRLVYRHPSAKHAQEAAEALATTLKRALEDVGLPASDLIGPAPAFFTRVRGRYRWQILLRSIDPAAFLREISIPAGWIVDIDPVDVL